MLTVNNLSIGFKKDNATTQVVDSVSFALQRGESLGVVGESGSGKSVTALSLLGLLPHPYGVILSGTAQYGEIDLFKATTDSMYSVRGRKIAMIFQEPMTALNPVMTIGAQICEMFTLHMPKLSLREQRQRASELMREMGIPSPEERLNDYPHQLSGGMRQRVMISMALACKPDILIADEPTTALDVTIQAQIMDLLQRLRTTHQMAIVLITHDLSLVYENCDRAIVMYAGQVVECASKDQLFSNPRHPYTKSLLRSIPTLTTPPKTKLATIPGMIPRGDEIASMNGCRFSNRCPQVHENCLKSSIGLTSMSDGHEVRCIRARETHHE